MKLKEVLEKITENLATENDLKIQIKSAEKQLDLSKNQLSEMQNKLTEGYGIYDFLKSQIAIELNLKAENLKSNLDSELKLYDDKNCVNLEFKFMGNKYNLVSSKYSRINHEDTYDVFDYSSSMDALFCKYLKHGNAVLNTDNVDKLIKIIELYNKNPKKVTAGFEKLKVESIVKHLSDKEKDLIISFDNNVKELDKLEEDINKAKVFKSPLLKKLFSKREKLEGEQNKLFAETEELGRTIKAIQMELADKSEIEKDAKAYVAAEIKSLQAVLDLIEWLDVYKYRLNAVQSSQIDDVKIDVDKLSKDVSNCEINLEDLRDMLKMNKKVKKETISMAFKDKDFIAEIDKFNPNKILKSEQKAYDLLQAKYDQIIAAKIKKMM